jgi:Ca-activated chloride channel family protein
VSQVHFAAPGWVHALWAVFALVAILFALERRGHAAIGRIVGPGMRARLVTAPSASRRRLGIVLLGLSGACLVVGLMRPQWGFRHFTAPSVGAEIMVALDVSRSMLAEDVAPSRLARAKAEIEDLLAYLDGDQVGLIAFAGRASVLSPLTPDFGFLRMVLESAGPQSVSRGGTRLAEPIRKAVAGFGPESDASRAILLITDGEDHDSFALDEAREAAEAGIKIIAIGFGDEAGSEIPVTDPRTGARTLLLDADGRPVRSRLDGDLLRDIALATGGAYVPAGTGVLDLESIYERHIARLTRGRLETRGRTVRDEHYQWPLLLGLVFLVSSVLATAGPLGARAIAVALLLLPLAGPPASAAVVAPSQGQAPAAGDEHEAASAAGSGEPESASATPRELYNRGVAALDARQLEDAMQALEQARSRAGADGELRFRASYNLGVAAARDAEALEDEKPREALARLDRAAAWFQEAVEQRGDDEDARHNLEVTLRRALILEDRLAREAEGDVAKQLAALAERQRAIAGGAAALLERTGSEAASDPHAVDRYRREFASQATAQRTLLADADALAERIAGEADGLESRPEDQKTAEERMRVVQLGAVLDHLHPARERMGQARSQLRRRQAERAYRRASAALEDLERARDPLRDPVSLLDAVVADAKRVAADTALLAASGREIPGMDRPLEPPAWLTPETLQDAQGALAERSAELDARLRAALQAPAAPDEPGASELVERAREAEPFVARAREQLEVASADLEHDAFDTAAGAQRQAVEALLEARERFLDVRGLIEAAYRTQRRIQSVLHDQEGAAAAVKGEYLASLGEVQAGNQERCARLGQRLDAEALADAAGAGADAAGAGAAADEETERLHRARESLGEATSAMSEVEGALRRGAAGWGSAAAASDQAVDQLEALRRLFFSIGERVRELAERELEIADATRDAAALAGASPPEHRSEALAPRQKTLAGQAGEVALELASQSDTAAEGQAPDAAESARKLRQAGEHVLAAEDAMDAAAAKLGADPAAPEGAREHQEESLRELGEALALLAPPDPQSEQQGGQQPQAGQQQQQASAQDQADGQQGAQAAQPDPAQLLQAVRDREAQRRRARSRAPRAGYEPVEKDW